jgi:hypothetical protein
VTVPSDGPSGLPPLLLLPYVSAHSAWLHSHVFILVHKTNVLAINLSLTATTPNVLPQLVARHLVPLNLLPRHGQLSSQTLEGALTQIDEALVQLPLVLLLRRGDLLGDACARAGLDRR